MNTGAFEVMTTYGAGTTYRVDPEKLLLGGEPLSSYGPVDLIDVIWQKIQAGETVIAQELTSPTEDTYRFNPSHVIAVRFRQ